MIQFIYHLIYCSHVSPLIHEWGSLFYIKINKKTDSKRACLYPILLLSFTNVSSLGSTLTLLYFKSNCLTFV